MWWKEHPLRNIIVGYPARGFNPRGQGHVWKEGNVTRRASCAIVMNLEGRHVDSVRSTMRIKGGHHYGPDNLVPAPLPNNVRIVYLDVRKVRLCSAHGVAFHGFVWPLVAWEAGSIMRTLFIDHCSWVDVLFVRGGRFCSHSSFHASNRVL